MCTVRFLFAVFAFRLHASEHAIQVQSLIFNMIGCITMNKTLVGDGALLHIAPKM